MLAPQSSQTPSVDYKDHLGIQRGTATGIRRQSAEIEFEKIVAEAKISIIESATQRRLKKSRVIRLSFSLESCVADIRTNRVALTLVIINWATLGLHQHRHTIQSILAGPLLLL